MTSPETFQPHPLNGEALAVSRQCRTFPFADVEARAWSTLERRRDRRRVNTWHGRLDTPSAPEWNFGLDLQATRAAVAGWPGPVVYDGFEVGGRVLVGNQVCATHPAGSPMRAVFDRLYGCGTAQSDGTWDPTASCAAVYGTAGVYTLGGVGGHNTVGADGRNAWQPGGRSQRYLVSTDAAGITARIDALLDAPQ